MDWNTNILSSFRCFSHLDSDHSRRVSSSPQQIQAQSLWTNGIERELNLGVTPTGLPMDPSVFEQTMLQVNSGLSDAGNRSVTTFMLFYINFLHFMV
ncbi:hypothetical protein Lalb_Chr01g0022351 [Lupinus albus]|uniref:Uncharacterized protein n=1 Tax=Lupinus albus TaxID=3870 RepID=A0A6A4R8A4_LUPAL|nr:hypothetical protein Lalb_Chr01g0022351 [Lupinus albus]